MNISDKKYIKLTNFFLISVIFLFSIFMNYIVEKKREMPWEPDDVSHYILKKTQMENCIINKCKFNQSFENYINDGSIKNQRIIKRTALEYHPLYSLIFLSIDSIIKNSYSTFYIISNIASLLQIIFLFKLFSIISKNFSKFKNIIFSFLFIIFLFDLIFMWRTAAKLSFVFFTYLLIPLISEKHIKKKYYFINFLQIFVHPLGIISSLIIYFFYFLKVHKYKFINLINLQISFYNKITIIFLLILILFYYQYGANYVNTDLSIHNALIKNNFLNIFQVNIDSAISYYTDTINYFYFILLLTIFLSKKIIKYKILIYIFFLINIIHLLNPSPEKSILNFFDFFIKFSSVLFLFEIIFINQYKYLKLIIILPIILSQIYYQSKQAYSFYKIRPIIDSLNYSKVSKEVENYLDNNSKIFLVSSSDLLLYHQLNNGLIDHNLYFNGLDNKNFEKYFKNNDEILLIFDLFNNPYAKNFNEKKIYDDSIRHFSSIFYKNDSLKIYNNSDKILKLKFFSKKNSLISVNNQKQEIKNNTFFEVKILPNERTIVKMNKIYGYLKLISINEKSHDKNFPWGENVDLIIYNDFLKKELVVNFDEKYTFETCKIKNIIDDSGQNIYAIANCK